jgi:hypothetical protein
MSFRAGYQIAVGITFLAPWALKIGKSLLAVFTVFTAAGDVF